MLPAKSISECKYSVFISYATLDDDSSNAWVSCFKDELIKALPGRVRRKEYTKCESFFSRDDPLVSGKLSDGLIQGIGDSFAMFIFVHENYVESSWCMKELEYFKMILGDGGFRERLYVIAMSETAIQKLTNKAEWKTLCPFSDQVWIKFYNDDNSNEPIEIYNAQVEKRAVATKLFWNQFVPILTDLAEKIGESAADEVNQNSYPIVTDNRTLPSVEEQLLVRVYVEANPGEEKYSETLGVEIVAVWDKLVIQESIDPILYLRPTGLPMREIDARPVLDDANGVVLLWSRKTPEAVAAQIRKVEPKLTGPRPAPGLIAYVVEDSEVNLSPRSIANWTVIRFQTNSEDNLKVVYEDIPILKEFLMNVLANKQV